MHKMRRRADLLVLLVAALACGAIVALFAVPTSPRFVREDISIPVQSGQSSHYTLALTIVRPRGDGPFGAIVLNHGVPLTARARQEESPELLIHTAAAFAQHGYAVIMPLRRGFGATGGRFAEDAGSCLDPHFARGERAAASDVLAAYDFARRLPYVDGERMILAGQSAGGVASLQAAAHSPPGLVAVLAFAAGRGGDPARSPGVPCAAERLATVFEALGREVKVPVLLHYAQNDLFFGPVTSQAWFRRFQAGGAPAEYVLQPPFGANGHFIFSDRAGIELWLPKVEDFLSRHRIPFDPLKQRV